jgi:hypothetical protein
VNPRRNSIQKRTYIQVKTRKIKICNYTKAFFFEFLAEFDNEKKKTKWEKIWTASSQWTSKMLGTGKSRPKGDFGLIGRIGQKFGYEIEAEWRRIDQIWYQHLPKPENCEEAPWRIDVMVEHENAINNLEYTLFKCEEISTPLKVGIFYPYPDDKENEEKFLKKSCEIIAKQVSSYPGGVYLIIFGFNDEEKGIYWHGYEIDSKGNAIKLQKS